MDDDFNTADAISVLFDLVKDINININQFYTSKIKSLYGEIIKFSALAQDSMDEEGKSRIYEYKLASRNIVEAIKDIRELHKNITIYLKSDNEFIKEEYNKIRINIASILNTINELRDEKDELEIISSLEVLKDDLRELDFLRSAKIDSLIRENKVDKKMATSLINDISFAYDISKNLIETASILLVSSETIRDLGDES